MNLEIGQEIPQFNLPNQNGEKVLISPKDGKKRIIYFYPKDDTKVCTEQACSFRDWQTNLVEMGFEVIGISNDSPSAHQKFISNHQLNFTLLSDEGGKVRKLFGASSFLGLIPNRKTFVTNEGGVVEFIHDAMFEGEGHIVAIKEFINKQ